MPQVADAGASMNKLVAIGDSVSMGFQSGAIYNTRISWPKIVAYEAGCDPGFRFPLFDGYGGLIAQEIINIMQLAKVSSYHGDGVSLRWGPVQVDFECLVKLDSLISKPPTSLADDLKLLGWLDSTGDVFTKFNPFSKSVHP